MVDRHFVLCIIVHRALEEEAQEALDAITACAGSQVAQQYQVQAKRSSQDGIAAKEVDLDLHRITHPTEG